MIAAVGTGALLAGTAAAAVAAYGWVQVARPEPDETERERRRTRRWALWATWGMLAAAVVAAAALEYALVGHDFSVRYVAENGNRAVPLYYTVISLWGALEGSLLLWLLVLCGYTVALGWRTPPRIARLQPWALAVMCAVATFFFWLAAFAGNAFETVSPAPADGPGPNPLLQDHPLMGVHPPLLYLGFVGLTVPFAYAVAALFTGRTGGAWVAATRRWTLFSWAFLTVGIVMGGWWSYEVLGWGGYWAWDPVENASIVPWFLATALLHSMMAQARRASLRVWNLTLAMATFVAVLVGTFLTRSGVIASVHSFTQSPIGPALLSFTVGVLVFAGVLLVLRRDRLGPDDGLGGGLSRESVFLGNNLLLVALAITVLAGTTFPLLAEAAGGDRISVGAPYYNRMAVPLALAVLLLMGIGPLLPWAHAGLRVLARRLAVPALAGLASVGALGVAGLRGIGALVTFGLAGFVLATIAARVAQSGTTVRRSGHTGRLRPFAAALARHRRLHGGLLVHAAVVMIAVAIAASQTYTTQDRQRLEVGESITVAGYTARLDSLQRHTSDRRNWVEATLTLLRDGTPLGTHSPQLSIYPYSNQAVGTPSVRTSLTEDVYLVLAQADEQGGSAVIDLSVHPLVTWLWIAAAVMAAGALLAGWPRRRRRPAASNPQLAPPLAVPA